MYEVVIMQYTNLVMSYYAVTYILRLLQSSVLYTRVIFIFFIQRLAIHIFPK